MLASQILFAFWLFCVPLCSHDMHVRWQVAQGSRHEGARRFLVEYLDFIVDAETRRPVRE